MVINTLQILNNSLHYFCYNWYILELHTNMYCHYWDCVPKTNTTKHFWENLTTFLEKLYVRKINKKKKKILMGNGTHIWHELDTALSSLHVAYHHTNKHQLRNLARSPNYKFSHEICKTPFNFNAAPLPISRSVDTVHISKRHTAMNISVYFWDPRIWPSLKMMMGVHAIRVT